MFVAPDDGEEVEEPPAAGERGQGGVARLLRLLGLVTVGLGPDQRQHQPAHTPPVQHPHSHYSHYLSSLLSHGENAVTGTFRGRLMLIIHHLSHLLHSPLRLQSAVRSSVWW